MSVRTLLLGLALLLLAALAATAQMTDDSSATGRLPSAYETARAQPETFTGTPPMLRGQPMTLQTAARGPVTITINDQPRAYDPPPMISQGHVLVPMRGIFEDLNATVHWEGNRQLATAKTAEGKTIALNVGSTTALVDGQPVTLEAPALIHQGRVFVPLRFLCESTGYQVAWEEAGRRVVIASRPGTTLAGTQLCPAPRIAMAPPEPAPRVAPPAPPEPAPTPVPEARWEPIPLTCGAPCPVATCPAPCPVATACPEPCPAPVVACPTPCPTPCPTACASVTTAGCPCG